MSMAYIRDRYKVPAKRGGRVRYTGNHGAQPPVEGTITGSIGAYLRVRLDGNRRSHVFPPTWKLEYLEEEA